MDRDRLPVLVGVAQWNGRNEALGDPLDRLEGLAREAVSAAGARRDPLRAVDTVGLVPVPGWSPANGPRLLGERLGATPGNEWWTGTGGEISLRLVNHAAEEIAGGRSRVALLAGLNTMRTLETARATGEWPSWVIGANARPTAIGDDRRGHDELEARHGLEAPIAVYPLLENALRARRGRALDAHREALGRLFAPFTRVAARNPYAWFPTERVADELVRVSAANRMIAYPYTKYLNAVLDTDQGAALLLCSLEAARELGIPEERWIYWWGGAHTEERAWHVSTRPALGDSPALRECARRTLAQAALDPGSLDFIDFYSCFPVAVELACEAYGVAEDDPRGLTVTGGLPYAGGPGSNYAMHAVATMHGRLRDAPGTIGLTTGNGWYLTKHSACVWSSTPPRTVVGAPMEAPAAVGPDPLPVRPDANGPAVVEGWTVVYARDGTPERGIVVGRLESGERFVANTPSERGFLEAFVRDEQVGTRGHVETHGKLCAFAPS